MTRMQWDKLGERLYHSGLDRGVLYPSGQKGVPWNGLISVTESSEGKAVTPLHQDGMKYVNEQPNEEYKATLQAFTYPDEFSNIMGRETTGSGLYFNQQYRKEFGLSYRSHIGSDTEGYDRGYRIHLVYNAIVLPEDYTRGTHDSIADPDAFTWDIITTPTVISGRKPTSTFSVSSEEVSPEKLQTLENILYGSSTTNPRLPTIKELVELFDDWPFLQIDQNISTGLGRLRVRGLKDLKGDLYEGIYAIPSESRLVGSPLSGIYKIGVN